MEIQFKITVMRPTNDGRTLIIAGEFFNAEGTVFGSLHLAEVDKELTLDWEIGKVVIWKI